MVCKGKEKSDVCKDIDTNPHINDRGMVDVAKIGYRRQRSGRCLRKDKWKTALEIYLDKATGRPASIETEALHFGKKMKDFITREFMERNGRRIAKRNAIFQHPLEKSAWQERERPRRQLSRRVEDDSS